MVSCFWNGINLIPLDFSLHREKGQQCEKATQKVKSAQKKLSLLNKRLEETEKRTAQIDEKLVETGEKTSASYLAKKEKLQQRKRELEEEKKEILAQIKENTSLKKQFTKALKELYLKATLYGLTQKERKEQHSKDVPSDTHGAKRRMEADKSKVQILTEMLKRAVKMGFTPDYVLTDTWFFSQKLLQAVSEQKHKIDLISAVKIGTQKVVMTDKEGIEISIKDLLKTKTAKIIKVSCKKRILL